MSGEPWKGVAGRLRAYFGAGWQVDPFGPDGYRYVNREQRIVVIATRADHGGQEWLHVSVSCPDRVPSWDELAAIKELVIGPDRHAYQVFPPRAQWISIHEHCLHLWARWDDGDGRVLPDFAAATNWASI